MSSNKKVPSRRIIEFDLLRGFFIIVIIVDHLQFWPSPLQYFTGQGRLWSSAAEGFFIISGLLIGYLRAYKEAHKPLLSISKKLWLRAAMLYAWCIGITFFVVAITPLLPGNGQMLPKLPDADQVTSLPVYIWNVVSTNYASDWIYFLRLYAILLAVTPLFLFLIRKKLWWVALVGSLLLYLASLTFQLQEAAFQWQILFIGAAFIGWKLEKILNWFNSRPKIKHLTYTGLIIIALTTMILSAFFVHGWGVVDSHRSNITRESYISIRSNVDPLFSNNPMVPLRIIVSFVWFFGLLALFHTLRGYLMRFLGWLLIPFGQASLTAYCLQAILLSIVVSYVSIFPSFWLNGVFACLVVIATWGLMRLKLIQDLLPK